MLAAAASLGACIQIDTGTVGVDRTLGKVNPEALPPGVHGTLFKSVDVLTANQVSFALDNLTPKSRDNLTMKDVDIDPYYKTSPADIAGLHTKYPGDMVRHGQVVKSGTSES